MAPTSVCLSSVMTADQPSVTTIAADYVSDSDTEFEHEPKAAIRVQADYVSSSDDEDDSDGSIHDDVSSAVATKHGGDSVVG
eukprot:3042854-Prymnesium_polylepis.2